MTKPHRATGAVTELLRRARIVPVLTVTDVRHAVPLARALVAGGLTVLEITLRTPVALDVAKAIGTEVPEAVVGIGTVLTPEDLDRARGIGARFALSPGSSPALLEAAAAGDLPFVPGVATASELMLALAHGFSVCKLFPADTVGGPAALRALGGPFPEARFCPTGGIDGTNFAEYLALPNVLAVGGSWLVPRSEVEAGDWQAITARTRFAMTGERTV